MWILGAFIACLIHMGDGKALEKECMYQKDMTSPFVPPKTIYVRRTGILYSPGFETHQNYPNGVQCSYQLDAPAGMHVRIHFNVLDIDTTNNCNDDHLLVYDFDSHDQTILQTKLCGKQIPFDYVSNSSTVALVLRTDDFVSRKGFNITYSLQNTQNVCENNMKQCRNRNCVEIDVLCDGDDDCEDGTDEENCPDNNKEAAVCGKPDIDPLKYSDYDRVVGGKKAVEGSWPWMADLNQNVIEPSGHVCGGTLINAQWVLTAAHCFKLPEMRKASYWRIHLGNYRKFDKDDHEQIRYAERIIIYDDIPSEIFEKDGKYDKDHDMALIKLNAPVKLTKYVQPVCLPNSSVQLDSQSTCYAVGWGNTKGTGYSEVLKQAYHPIQPGSICKGFVKNAFKPDTMICAGSMRSLNGVCHGDSGGPLHCKLGGVWNIVGVASYVVDGNMEGGLCGLAGRPSVFNKVAVKTAWIRKMIKTYG